MRHAALASGASQAQFSTFIVSGQLYGIEVTSVQEVVRPLPMTPIPLAPSYVRGLVNLRGQVAVAIGVRELFELPPEGDRQVMNVVCRCDDQLIALLVDDIGDVIEVSRAAFEVAPPTIPAPVRRFMTGVMKIDGPILSIIDVEHVARFLNR